MSNDLTIAGMTLPAHIMARVGRESALTKSLAGGIGGGEIFPRISIKGSRFRIVEGDEETIINQTYLDVVVVGANPKLSKVYYAGAWDASDTKAPDCKSLGGVRPDDDSTAKQHDICATCPQNVWGSKIGPQGQKLKSCTDQKRLAVVSPEDLEGPIYLLQVTPAALKGLNAFQKALASRGIAPEIVKTRITFDTEASFPKLVFGLGGFLEEAEIEVVEQIIAREQVKQVTGEDDPTMIQATAAVSVAAKPVMVKATPAAAPIAVPVEEAPAAAVLKRGFGAKAAAAAAAPVRATPVQATPAAAPVAAKKKPTVVKAIPIADTGNSSLAEEIANMIGEEGSDDA